MDIKEHRAGSARGTAGRHPWELARVKIVEKYLLRHVPSPFSVVDIGCGDAFVMEQLARDFPGTQFYGVDTAFDDQLLTEYTERIGNSSVRLYRSAGELPPELSAPSAVLLLDVIEHISDDAAFLGQIASLPQIGNDTVFLITVPAYPGLFTIHDTWLGHYRRYTLRSLHAALKQVGLKPVDSGYLFFSLFLARAVQKVLQAVRKPDESQMTGIGGWKSHPVADRLIVFFLLADVALARFLRIFGIRLPGLSCIAVCRRQ